MHKNGFKILLGGKLGNLAKQIAEETAGNLNLDMENVTDMNDVFQNLFYNFHNLWLNYSLFHQRFFLELQGL